MVARFNVLWCLECDLAFFVVCNGKWPPVRSDRLVGIQLWGLILYDKTICTYVTHNSIGVNDYCAHWQRPWFGNISVDGIQVIVPVFLGFLASCVDECFLKLLKLLAEVMKNGVNNVNFWESARQVQGCFMADVDSIFPNLGKTTWEP